MKAEKEVILESAAEAVAEEVVVWPEPETEFGRKILALAKEIDASGIPMLSLEEIEEYLGRKFLTLPLPLNHNPSHAGQKTPLPG
jgi:hypothetical protein